VMTEGSHGVELDPELAPCVAEGEALLVPDACGAGVPDPGRTMMSTTTTMTATSTSKSRRRRRQYTDGGCGPTGFLIVDMPPG